VEIGGGLYNGLYKLGFYEEMEMFSKEVANETG